MWRATQDVICVIIFDSNQILPFATTLPFIESVQSSSIPLLQSLLPLSALQPIVFPSQHGLFPLFLFRTLHGCLSRFELQQGHDHARLQRPLNGLEVYLVRRSRILAFLFIPRIRPWLALWHQQVLGVVI